MRRKTIALAGAAALIAAGAGWYFASPGYAMSELRDAAVAADRDELEKRIDFSSVRESLKAELAAAMAVEVARDPAPDGFEAFGAMMATAMVGGVVDSLVTPEGMAAMLRRGHLQRPGDAAKTTDEPPVEWHIERDGLDRFTAQPEGNDPKAPKLVFERDGLSWRLARLDMPDDLMAAPAE